MSIRKIFVILPYKESVNPNSAGAVSIYVKDTSNYSKYKKDIKIISSENFEKVKIFKNKNYIMNFCNRYKNTKIDIIEIHNRPEYLTYIKKYFPSAKINLFFHNDPLTLRGSESIDERKYILSNTNKIIFLSNWIQQMFFYRLKNVNLDKVISLPVGIIKEKNIKLSQKKKNILFVGKLNKAKGYHIFCNVASKFKKYDPSWNFIAIGNEARKEIFPSKNSVTEIGYLKNREVLDLYKKSEIAIGNSVWNEPLGRIAIESSSRKCLPIISNKGGLSESKNIAHVLKKNTPNELFKYLVKITKNNNLRKEKQNLFYKNNNFDLSLSLIEDLLSTYPKNLILNTTKAEILLNARMHKEALDQVNSSLKISPRNYPLTVTKVRILNEMERYFEAEELLRDQILKRNNDPYLWLLLSEVQRDGRNIVGYYQSKAEYHVLLGQYEDAINQLEFALQYTKNNFQVSESVMTKIIDIKKKINKSRGL